MARRRGSKSWKNSTKARRQLEEAGDAYERWVADAEVAWAERGWSVEELKEMLLEGREEEVEERLGGPPPVVVPTILEVGMPGRLREDGDVVPMRPDGSGGFDEKGTRGT